MDRQRNKIVVEKAKDRCVEREFVRSISELWYNRRRKNNVNLFVAYEYYHQYGERLELVTVGWLAKTEECCNYFSIRLASEWELTFVGDCLELGDLYEQSAWLLIMMDFTVNLEYSRLTDYLPV